LFILSEQLELQERASAEAAAALASGIDANLPERLPLLRMIVDEVLRLYPSAPRFDREAVAADKISEIDVEPGDFLSVWPWLIHRHRKLWNDPDAFVPERFSPESKDKRHRFQYIPFGAGPRTCVGARFAMAEGLTILASWLAKWRFKPMPGREVQVSGMVTLRPKGGLPLMITRR
jgi:cytochrome P450